jgi:type IV secretory pathway VirB10-like protein
MEFIRNFFRKKRDINDFEDDLLNLGNIEEDSIVIDDNQSQDRHTQEPQRTWLKGWMISVFFVSIAVLVIYWDTRKLKLDLPKSQPKQTSNSNFKPFNLNWDKEIDQVESHLKEKTKIAERTSTHKAKDKIKPEIYGEFRRYNYAETSKQPSVNNEKRQVETNKNDVVYSNNQDAPSRTRRYDQQIAEVKAKGEAQTLSRNDFYEKMIANANPNKEEKRTTLNERLDVEPLKKVHAVQDVDLDYQIHKSTKISAIVNEHMSTDLGGFISSVITRNIYSSNGKKLILPAGSIATGRYPAGLKRGISLAFTTWEDIRTPCGGTIHLQSPGASPMGLPGQKLEIDSHFIERFGSSMMLSLVNAGVSIAGGFATQGNSQTISDIQQNLNKSSEIALQDSIGIKPTGYARAGQEISILVARDLNFKNIFKDGEMICEK